MTAFSTGTEPLSAATRIRSMLTTVAVISDLLQRAAAAQGVGPGLAEPVSAAFASNFPRILCGRRICEAGGAAAAHASIAPYIEVCWPPSSVRAGGEPSAEAVRGERHRIARELLARFVEEQALLVASNAISAVLLSAIQSLVQRSSTAIASGVVGQALAGIGRYSATSLALEASSPRDKCQATFAWVLGNGNPEMSVQIEREPEGFRILQQGLCRQWENARILGIEGLMAWPVNLPALETILQNTWPSARLEVVRGQCLGDGICEFRCRAGGADAGS
jgi:hypothetical protein